MPFHHALFDDLADPRSCEQRDKNRRKVGLQVADLTRRRRDGGFRRELIDLLQQRREGEPDRVQFEALPSRQGYETLVVAGELLVRTAEYDDQRVRGFLEQEGFAQARVDCLDGRVVRLSNSAIPAARLDNIARLLRREGLTASVNHICPLGPVAKGRGGPEPAEVRREPVTAKAGARGDALIVAVVDTGISAEMRSDGWLAAVPRDDNIDQLDELPGGGDGFLDLGAGHGTFVAGVVQQVAPAAELRVYRALDSDGIGSEVDVACAMVQAVRDGARILNLSVGSETLDDQPPVALSVALELIGEFEAESGQEVLVVAAAGNFGSTRPCWPAAFRRVVAVAGLTADLEPSTWSSRGFWVDCSAVGEGVLSTYVAGQESYEIDLEPDTFPDNAWALWTGSSFAAPQVAGAVARLCHERGLAPRRALYDLLRQGTPLPDFGQALPLAFGT